MTDNLFAVCEPRANVLLGIRPFDKSDAFKRAGHRGKHQTLKGCSPTAALGPIVTYHYGAKVSDEWSIREEPATNRWQA